MKPSEFLLPAIILVGIIGIFVLGVPTIDEFETFNCITTPREIPQITIYQYLDREYINPPVYQIPDCMVEAC